jgi:uncharacterized membrane protein
MNERRIHQIFEISVLLKGSHAVIECIGGLALALVSNDTILFLANKLTQDELIEDPHDFVATHLMTLVNNFSVSSQYFYAFYLLSHGVVKIALVTGLLMNRMWAYPASMVVLSLFMAYQVYRFCYTQSLGLVLLTLFDAVVMALIWHEYRLLRHHRGVEGQTSGGEPLG